MTDRRYTLAEIKAMRKTLSQAEWRRDGISRLRSHSEIEELIQTYMLAGITPEELEADRVREYKAMSDELSSWCDYLRDNPEEAKRLHDLKRKAFPSLYGETR